MGHACYFMLHTTESLFTSDNKFSKVGDCCTSGGQRDAAVEILLPTLRLHLESRHQSLVAQSRQHGRIQDYSVSPLTAQQRSHRDKSAVNTPAQPRVYLKYTQLIKNGQPAEKQTGRQRRVRISYMGGRDNKYVINVSGNNAAFACEG